MSSDGPPDQAVLRGVQPARLGGASGISLPTDAVYHNMPGPPVRGKAAIKKAVLERFLNPAQTVEFVMLNMAAADSVVFTERLDRFVIAGKTVELPVAGVFQQGQAQGRHRHAHDAQKLLEEHALAEELGEDDVDQEHPEDVPQRDAEDRTGEAPT